jgi:monoamine oxidase
VVFHFREPFWTEVRREDPNTDPTAMGFLLLTDTEFPTWWTAFPFRAPILTAWVGGPRAAGLAGLSQPEVADRALHGLVGALGMPRSRVDTLVEGSWYHDWHTDPLSRGTYSYGVVGGIDAPRVLMQPLADTLFLTGEHTSLDGRSGTVHGAITAGLRTAESVLGALK